MAKYTYIREIIINDGENPVDIEIWKDNESGGIFAIDSSFLDQNVILYNPFNGQIENIDQELPPPE